MKTVVKLALGVMLAGFAMFAVAAPANAANTSVVGQSGPCNGALVVQSGSNWSLVAQDNTGSCSKGNSAQVWQDGNNNSQATLQGGKKNSAVTVQDGNGNIAGTLQVGKNNTAGVWQDGNNNLGGAAQFGKNNSSVVEQTGNNNLGGALQFGKGNQSFISQTGNGNGAIVVQSN